MHARTLGRLAGFGPLLVAAVAAACGDTGIGNDAGRVDGGSDASLDAGNDAGSDAGVDAGPPCEVPAGDVGLDAYGGDARVEREATGFFRVERICDSWWLITPAGHPFWSLGINHVVPDGDTGATTGRQPYGEAVARLYPSREDWADATAQRARQWGFNTAGAWSDVGLMMPRMPAAIVLNLGGGDLFSPEWEASVEQTVASTVMPRADEPNLVGWFLANEMRWGPHWQGDETLLQLYLQKSAGSPGKQAAVDFLIERYGSVQGVGEAFGTSFADRDAILAQTDGWARLNRRSSSIVALNMEFLGRVADRYFRITTAAVRAADPNHLILGNREISVLTPLPVWEAAARYVDVVSVNNYVLVPGLASVALSLSGGLDLGEDLGALYEHTGRPILITEFSFRAADSGLPNTYPPVFPVLSAQEERADAFEAYVRTFQGRPWMVGYHWFEWVDEPADGRFDGEDSNFGLVSVEDQPYTALVDRMTAVNPAVYEALRIEP